jgi:hypothetical protein
MKHRFHKQFENSLPMDIEEVISLVRIIDACLKQRDDEVNSRNTNNKNRCIASQTINDILNNCYDQ